ncbi:MAG: heavy-metal-associated domain-containing protein [Gemmatimonadales bacterium]|nr:heavy-metal-associated domain-containing protein [Gemmatimonadales bacterium]
MQEHTLAISGMSCGGCVNAVRKALSALPGTQVDAVAVGSATVSYDTGLTAVAALEQAVRDAGFDLDTAGVAGKTGDAGSGHGCCG